MESRELPEVNFVDLDVENMLENIVKDYEDAYFKQTSERIKLYPGDPMRVFLYTQALREYQLRCIIDRAAKMNLLAYAEDEYLDHIGEPFIKRLNGKYAKVNVKISLSKVLEETIKISKTNKVSDGNLFFVTEEDILFLPGETEKIVSFFCTKIGTAAHDISIGSINSFEKPERYVMKVENIDKPHDGEEVERDDEFRIRIHNAPSAISVAGPETAYKSMTYAFSTRIRDVSVDSPSPGKIDIYVLLDEEMEDSFKNDLQEYINNKERRPMTDFVLVKNLEKINYEISFKYYAEKPLILNDAIEKYKKWQEKSIGRDVNPSMLVKILMDSGVERVEVQTQYIALNINQIAKSINENIIYGGKADV